MTTEPTYEYRIHGKFGLWGETFEGADPLLNHVRRWIWEDLKYARERYPDEPDHFVVERRQVGEWERTEDPPLPEYDD